MTRAAVVRARASTYSADIDAMRIAATLALTLFPAAFQPWTVMILPSGGFLVMGIWLLVVNRVRQWQETEGVELEEAVK